MALAGGELEMALAGGKLALVGVGWRWLALALVGGSSRACITSSRLKYGTLNESPPLKKSQTTKTKMREKINEKKAHDSPMSPHLEQERNKKPQDSWEIVGLLSLLLLTRRRGLSAARSPRSCARAAARPNKC